MASYTSIAEGDWANPVTWTPPGPPGADDNAVIEDYKVTVGYETSAAASLIVKSGMLYLNNQALNVGGDCIFYPDAQMEYMAPPRAGVLAVGGNCYIRDSKHALLFGHLTVAGDLRGIRAHVRSTLIEVTGRAVFLKSLIRNVDASGGNRIVVYGSKGDGSNTNVDFYLARGKRAMLVLNRRAFQTGLAA